MRHQFARPGTIARIDDEAVWCWQRGTAHKKKFPINPTVLLIFYWLVARAELKRHGGPFNKSERGRARRSERRWRAMDKRSFVNG